MACCVPQRLIIAAPHVAAGAVKPGLSAEPCLQSLLLQAPACRRPRAIHITHRFDRALNISALNPQACPSNVACDGTACCSAAKSCGPGRTSVCCTGDAVCKTYADTRGIACCPAAQTCGNVSALGCYTISMVNTKSFCTQLEHLLRWLRNEQLHCLCFRVQCQIADCVSYSTAAGREHRSARAPRAAP